MAAPMPLADDKRMLLDSIYNRSNSKGTLDEIYNRTVGAESEPQAEPSISRRGGIYEQFGPRPPVFEPVPKPMGGFVEAGADQPGSAMVFAGQAAGGFAGPVGGVAGALAGEAGRQYLGRKFGVQDNTSLQQFKKVGTNAIRGEALGFGVGKSLQFGSKALAPQLKSGGVRMAQNIIRPTGRYAKRGEQIAETALREGVLRSGARETAEAAASKIDPLMQEVDDIAASITDQMTAERGLKRMDALERWYVQRGSPERAGKIRELKNNLVESMKLREPVYSMKEKGQFVMRGPARFGEPRPSTSTTPIIDNIPAAGRKKAPILDAVRRGEVPTSRSIEKPEDMMIIQRPRKQLTVVRPETKTEILPEVVGPSNKEAVLTGFNPRSMSVKEGLNIRRGQDALLKTTKAGGGYTAETNSPEIMGRQEFAGGLRKDIGRVSPEIKANNKRISQLIDLSKASGKRADVSSRNNLMDLTDSMMTTASVLNPKALALLAARKAWQGGKAGIARGMYNAPSFGKDAGLVLTSPAVRALLGLENDQ